MVITEKRIAANRRNIELGREKAKLSMHRIKEYNQTKTEHTFTCTKCGKEFTKAIRNIDYEKGRWPLHCSRSCANGRERTPELRQKLSEKLKRVTIVEGTRISVPITRCKNCGAEIHHKLHTRVYCSDQCRIEYRKRQRANAYSAEFINYRNACKFKFNLADYPDEFDFELIKKYGWYSPVNKGNNPGGVSRDHMYSVKAGYINKVPATIIEHPANCKLILQTKNTSKGSKCSITLEELKNRIAAWEAKYGPYKCGIWANPNQSTP